MPLTQPKDKSFTFRAVEKALQAIDNITGQKESGDLHEDATSALYLNSAALLEKQEKMKESVQRIEKKLFDKYVEKDEDGEPVFEEAKEGEQPLPKLDRKAFNEDRRKKVENLYEQPVNVEVYTVSVRKIRGIPASLFSPLVWMIDYQTND